MSRSLCARGHAFGIATSCLAAIVWFSLAASRAQADPITLFNTGVDEGGHLLADGGVDAHYRLISSPDIANPGPRTYVVNSSAFPFDQWWMPDGPNSKWIGPNTNQPTSVEGAYT